MIHAGGGGLDPLKAPGGNDPVPIDGNFGMAAEDICGKELFRDVFLFGSDDFRILGGSGTDLVDVVGLDWVAEYDAHRFGSI
jgi:hypothetical protein